MRVVFFVRCGPQPYFDSNKGYTEVRGSAISALTIYTNKKTCTNPDWPMSNRLLGRDQDGH